MREMRANSEATAFEMKCVVFLVDAKTLSSEIFDHKTRINRADRQSPFLETIPTDVKLSLRPSANGPAGGLTSFTSNRI